MLSRWISATVGSRPASVVATIPARRALRTLRRALDSISSSSASSSAGRSVTWLMRSSVRLCAGSGGWRSANGLATIVAASVPSRRRALVVGGDQRGLAPPASPARTDPWLP